MLFEASDTEDAMSWSPGMLSALAPGMWTIAGVLMLQPSRSFQKSGTGW